MNEPEQHTPAYKLFYYQFYCKVPTIHTVTEEWIRERGVLTTGDKARDAELANAPIDIMATIKQIAEYHRDGVSVILNNPEDSVRVYEIITEFMSDYNKGLESSFNVTVHDRDFFRNLDSLATEVYKIARRYLPNQLNKGGLFDKLDNLGRRSVIKRGGERKTTMQKEHKPMSDSISIKSLEREKQWR